MLLATIYASASINLLTAALPYRPPSTRQLFTRSLRDLSVSINLVTVAPPYFNTQYVPPHPHGLRVAQLKLFFWPRQ